MRAPLLSVCLEKPVLLDELLGLLDSRGNVEDVVNVIGSSLQLYIEVSGHQCHGNSQIYHGNSRPTMVMVNFTMVMANIAMVIVMVKWACLLVLPIDVPNGLNDIRQLCTVLVEMFHIIHTPPHLMHNLLQVLQSDQPLLYTVQLGLDGIAQLRLYGCLWQQNQYSYKWSTTLNKTAACIPSSLLSSSYIDQVCQGPQVSGETLMV